MVKVFFSYNRVDGEIAARLADSLESRGISVFRDMESLVSGEVFSHAITEAMSRADAVVVLLSSHSKRSSWVDRELQSALEQEKVIVPILLDADAKNNWIWPLVSDRFTINVNESTEYNALVGQLEDAIVHGKSNSDDIRKNKNIQIQGNSNVNLEASIANVQQSIASSDSIDLATLEDIKLLLIELEKVLAHLPPELQRGAARVGIAAEMLMSESLSESPNRSFLKIAREGLKEASEIIEEVAPDVRWIIERILNTLDSVV
jgi:hypothetical protein